MLGCNCRIFAWYLCFRSHNSLLRDCLRTSFACLSSIYECRKATSRIGKWRQSGGQPVGKGHVVDISTSALFPRREEYTPVPNVCQMHQLWGRDLTTKSSAGTAYANASLRVTLAYRSIQGRSHPPRILSQQSGQFILNCHTSSRCKRLSSLPNSPDRIWYLTSLLLTEHLWLFPRRKGGNH